MNKSLTMMRITRDNLSLLQLIGHNGESLNDVVSRLLSFYIKEHQEWFDETKRLSGE